MKDSPAGRFDDVVLDEVKRLVLEGLAETGAEVFLFGSRARGDSAGNSDIDVAIAPSRPLPAGLLARLREALEESTVPYLVDLIDLSEADPGLRERVRREGIPWTG